MFSIALKEKCLA